MKRIFQNIQREEITPREIVISLAVILIVAALAMFTEQWHKDYIKVCGFFSMLLVIVHLRRYFFPFIFASIACYLIASTQLLLPDDLQDKDVTQALWFCGDILLPIGFFHLIYRLIFKYEIVKRHQNKPAN